MRRFVPPYPEEFREQMVELVRVGGRSPAELSREFPCSASVIRNWVAASEPAPAQAKDRATPAGSSLTSAERAELDRLRRDNARLQVERDILAKATAWFAAKSEKTPTPSSNS
jgi:transposase